jgi:fibronectin-binding autotransporter adhesin
VEKRQPEAAQPIRSSNRQFFYIEDSNTEGTAGTTLVAASPVLAQPSLDDQAVTFGNFRPGASLSQNVWLANNNLPTSNNYSQALAATSTTSGAASISGVPSFASPLPQGGAAGLTLGLASGSAGPASGQTSFEFRSVPGSSATTGTTAVGSGTIALSGTGYDWANAKYSGATLNFGNIHVGGTAAAQTVAIGNQTATNSAYQDTLNVSGSTGNALVTATGFTGLAASASGATTQNLVVAVNSGSVGSLASSVALSLISNANGVAGLSNGAATVVGTPGAITTVGQVYSGQSIWNTNGGGQWGTLTTNFGTNWQQYNGSPGLDSGFSDTDTATFGTAVTSGTATVTITSATASVRALTFSNGAASYALTGSAGGALVIRGGTTNATVDVTAGTHAIAAPLTFASNVAMDVATGSRLLLSGGASGTNGFIKTGGGILEIVNTNGYTGTTVADGGILKVNGTLSSSAVQIGSTATLMGSGTIGGNTLVAGTHSPGNSPDVQTFEGNLTYEPNATVIWELIGNTNTGRGTSFDGIDVGGTLTFGNPTNLVLAFNLPESTVNWGNAFWGTSREGTNGWLVYSVAGSTADQLVGFGNLVLNVQNWADATGNLLQNVRPGASFATFQDGNDVYLTYIAAVPEPATLGSLAAAGFCLLGFAALRRRRSPPA